ncbi:MAG TPA: hypothetical protein VF006_06425 [Longimicrobium sp.]
MLLSPLQATVTMPPETVGDLKASGSSLLAFAAVRCGDQAAQPLVWMATSGYLETTIVQSPVRFQAYTAAWPPDPGPVVPGDQTEISLGQTLTVPEAGIGTLTQDGVERAITIRNASSTAFACGISRMVGGRYAPICRLPLYGHNGQVIEPVPAILLIVSTLRTAAGTPCDTAVGPGVLLDLSTTRQVQVSYDINTGWDWKRATWGHAVEFGQPLQPLLVGASADLTRRVATSQ